MSLICGLSGEVPEEPVVAPGSGVIFERRLVEKWIEEYGTDPVRKDLPLAKEQLIQIETSRFVKPKIAPMAGIPGLLNTLQTEWDAVMLYNHSLKTQLQATRQELSYALYQHDAACRVIVRLQKELAGAREALATLKPLAAVSNGVDGHDVEMNGPGGDAGEAVVEIPPAVEEKIDALYKELSSQRKTREKPPVGPALQAKNEHLRSFQVVHNSVGFHRAGAGIVCMDLHPEDNQRVATGGTDGVIVIHQREPERILAEFSLNKKTTINKVAFVPTKQILVSASDDNKVRTWNIAQDESGAKLDSKRLLRTFNFHSGPVKTFSIHPSNDILLSGSIDGTWTFADLETGQPYRLGADPEALAVTNVQFHPDGNFFGIGNSNGVIRFYDLRRPEPIATFEEKHGDAVTSMCFSENGYTLVTSARDNTVYGWHIGKGKITKTFNLPPDYRVHEVKMDRSSNYLAISGSDLRLYSIAPKKPEDWTEVKVFGDHTADVTSARFGPDDAFLVSASMDKSVKYYAAAATPAV